MAQQPNFDAKNWPVDEALFWIFFSDEKATRLQAQRCDDPYAAISKWLSTSQKLERTKDEPLDLELGKLEPLRERFPQCASASPLLWIRFAFSALRTGIAPAGYFFRQYANWRFDRSRRFGAETIARVSIAGKKPNPLFSKIATGEIEGLLFDRFFLAEKPISETEWTSEWEYLSVSKLPKTRAPRVDICEHVGRKAFQRIADCITLAAKEGRIAGLSKQRRNQKYSASMTRAELAEALQRRYGKRLACQTSTIIRSLSDLVTCRKKSN